MRFNPTAFLVFIAVCLLVAMALSRGPEWKSAGEAGATVVIALSLIGFMRGGRRPR